MTSIELKQALPKIDWYLSVDTFVQGRRVNLKDIILIGVYSSAGKTLHITAISMKNTELKFKIPLKQFIRINCCIITLRKI